MKLREDFVNECQEVEVAGGWELGGESRRGKMLCCNKIKFTLGQGMKTHRGRRLIPLLFL